MRKELIGVGVIQKRGIIYIPIEALEKAGIPKDKINKAPVKVAIYYAELDGSQGIFLRPIQVIEGGK
jgi:hypothetical protein